MLSTHTQLTGTIATPPVCCPHCSKQYSSKVWEGLWLHPNQGYYLRNLLREHGDWLFLNWWGTIRGILQFRWLRRSFLRIGIINPEWEENMWNFPRVKCVSYITWAPIGFLFPWSAEGLILEYFMLVLYELRFTEALPRNLHDRSWKRGHSCLGGGLLPLPI